MFINVIFNNLGLPECYIWRSKNVTKRYRLQ